MQATTDWLHSRLAAQTEKIVALVVHDDELKAKTLDCLSHVHDSGDFMQDLAMKKHNWFYTKDTKRRCLLLHYKTPAAGKDGAVNHAPAMRALGVLIVGQLQGMKVAHAEVLVSSKIDAEHMGVFYNSIHLTNYSASLKSHIDKEEKKGDHGGDERNHRFKKTVDSITIGHESDYEKLESFNYWKHCTHATIFARDLIHTRGNPATTAWMEEQVRNMLDKNEDAESKQMIKEVRVLKGEQLKEIGMNCFYAVGQAAVEESRCVIVHY